MVDKQCSAALALLLLAGLLAGCGSSANSSHGEASTTLVDVAKVLPAEKTSKVNFSGRIESVRRASLSFGVVGELDEVTVDVGDRLEAEQTLAVLDDTRYQLAYDRSVAAEKEAKAALDEARLALERQRRLNANGFSSPSQLDSASAALESARSRHESATASRRIAARDLHNTTLEAPFPGVVSQRFAEPSERVSPSQPVLEVVSVQEGFEVITRVPENLVGRLRRGPVHSVRVPALGGKWESARIRRLGAAPLSSNNYPVVLGLRDSVNGLRPGMTVRVRLSTGDASGQSAVTGVLSVPLTALVYDREDRAHVLRLDKNNRLESVGLRILQPDGQRARVVGDLRPGDRIVERGVAFVSPGDVVAVLGEGHERFR